MSQIENSLIGFIIGDALGIPLEFEPRENLIKNPVLEMTSYGTHNVKAGSWSSNTSLTLATMESIVKKKGIDYHDLMKNYLSYYKNHKYLSCERSFGLSRSLKNSLKEYQKNKKLFNYINNQNTENSSLKRCLPIAFYTFYKKYTNDQIYLLIKDFSSLTHPNETVILGCYIYTKYIHFLLEDITKKEAYLKLKKLDLHYFSKETINLYHNIITNNISDTNLKDISTSDYIVDTMETSLWIILNTDTFSQALVGAINLGGDTASIGAITGSIAGLIYNEDEIPNRWKEKLLKVNYIEKIIEDYDIFLNL